MRSPRSVSTTSMPRPSRYLLSSISSVAIDLLLVTTIFLPAGSSLPALKQIWPMISRASAASLAKCATPPTAASRCVNCSSSSGKRSRLACRRRFSSARPFSKSKDSKARLRRPRKPVIAWISACCSLGSSSALPTRPEKCLRLSGTRRGRFSDGLRHFGWCRHRRQAYGPDAHHRPVVSVRIDHRVGMRGSRRAGELWIASCDLDRVRKPIKSPREHGRHQTVLPGQLRNRLEGAARALAIGRRRFCKERVELDQRHRRDRVLREGLDALVETAQILTARVVEVAA